MQFVRGSFARSHFRLERLLIKINYTVPNVHRVSAEFIYLIDSDMDLNENEYKILIDLLRHDSNPAENKKEPKGDLILVLPKGGTISPWSNRATDIMHHCGLKKIKRIERAIAYYVDAHGKLTWGDKQAIAAVLFDERTERVFYQLEEVNSLFSENSLYNLEGIDLFDAVIRLLKSPYIADKSYLITICDRTVTGLVSRDQMVGPWQVPVSDCTVTARSFVHYQGEAFAKGERPLLSVMNPIASARMAVGEAIMNIAAANIGVLSDIKLLIHSSDASSDALQTISLELCPALGVALQPIWPSVQEKKGAVPNSLVVSAFAPVIDVRKTLTPLLETENRDTALIFIDLSGGQTRLGGSAFAEVVNRVGGESPDLTDPNLLKGFFACLQQLVMEDKILAYHDRSDGGLLMTLLEMAFASHVGLKIDITELGTNEKAILFNEELGAVIQVDSKDIEYVISEFKDYHISQSYAIGKLTTNDKISIILNNNIIFKGERIALQKAWVEPSFSLQSIRDNPRTAKNQYDAINDAKDPGLNPLIIFDMTEEMTASMLNLGIKPKIAILREQGTNSHLEMTAAFNKAHFEAVNVHLDELEKGQVRLENFKGLVFCGGFSYGDVLGAGLGFAKRILLNPALSHQFQNFFHRKECFTLGVSNGCQVLAILKSLIPGAERWPEFIQNFSEQFESRLCLVEIQPSPSILFQGMAGSCLLVPVAHKEGRAAFKDETDQDQLIKQNLVTLQYVDNYGRKTKVYPANPSGSPLGMTGFTTPDGRINIMMPHPERAFRTVQYSWCPKAWGLDAPWLRLFQNARRWVG